MTRTTLLCSTLALALPAMTHAQSLGTFRWQLQPYCNVVAVGVTQVGGVYRLEGTDDQCGGGRDLASVQGLAFPNPDGTIGFGMTIVTAPGGAPVHVDAEMSIATLGGTWRDSAGATGTFRFTPGAGSGGNPRPQPASIPAAIHLLTSGGLLATGRPGTGAIPASGSGYRLMWHPAKGAFRAGSVSGKEWDDSSIGSWSTAFGMDTVASGHKSLAAGANSRATGESSVALGEFLEAAGEGSIAVGLGSRAFGRGSIAMGVNSWAMGAGGVAFGASSKADGDTSVAGGERSEARGRSSVAFGEHAIAAGDFSFAGGAGSAAGGSGALAYGQLTFANGDGSVALGSNAVAAAGAFGSFVFADRSSGTQLFSLKPNEFVARAAGGVLFLTNAAATSGVAVAPGAGSWSSVSDVHLKEHFRELDGDDVLARIARMPVREWNYTTQNPAIRHMGPTAQDFRAAFGLGESDVRISTIDADGVALAGVRALEARTRSMREELNARVAELRDENRGLREAVAELQREVAGAKAHRPR